MITHSDENRSLCACCGSHVEPRQPDPWEGRLDGYCYDCALAGCDTSDGQCPNLPPLKVTVLGGGEPAFYDFGPPSGASLIMAERQRQKAVEGWTAEHDDEHNQGEMVDAAVCYALHAAFGPPQDNALPENWPWADLWWKPSDDPVRDLVRAGALIAAEIDRLQRLVNACDLGGGTDAHG